MGSHGIFLFVRNFLLHVFDIVMRYHKALFYMCDKIYVNLSKQAS